MPALEKSIVLGADFHYATQITTTIKSILYHNSGVKIYLIHNDIPVEWFHYISRQLAPLGITLQGLKVKNEQIKGYRTWGHISHATFFRYFIPKYIPEARVLYLDCDLIVTGSLDELFALDLGHNYVAAVEDSIAKAYYKRADFNAGVLLINNHLWRQDEIMRKALELNQKYDKLLNDADQSVLNMLFAQRWLALDFHYNYLTGLRYLLDLEHKYLREYPESYYQPVLKPLIIHYNTAGKPWTPEIYLHYKDEWWFYHNLSWQEIYARHAQA